MIISIVITNTERSIYYLKSWRTIIFSKNIIYLDDLIVNKTSKFLKKRYLFLILQL